MVSLCDSRQFQTAQTCAYNRDNKLIKISKVYWQKNNFITINLNSEVSTSRTKATVVSMDITDY